MPSKPSRRALVVLFAAMCGLVAPAAAQEAWPTRPLRLIVPYSAGGASDVMARYFGQKLGELLGQSVVIENQAGAAGTAAYVAVAKAAADGTTLGYATPSLGINAVMKPKLGYDPVADFAPVSTLLEIQNIFVVPASSPVKSVAELVALAKQKPGELNYVTLGVGSTPHLSAELFTAAAGIKAQGVPYKLTTQAYTDLIEGRVDFWIASGPSALPHVQSGKLRALAVAGPKRSATLPDVPTLVEQGVPAESTFWNGVVVPAHTPAPIVAKLNDAMRRLIALPETKAWYANLGAEIGASTPVELSVVMRKDMERWSKIVRDLGLQSN